MKDRVALVLLASMLMLVTAEVLFVPPHYVAGFHAAIGLVACVVVVLLSKALGRALLQRPEATDES
jgi:lipopolysaccharide export LptBFGC system permease protein LptF